MSSGSPVIRHIKGKRNIEKDIEFELKGDLINTYLWNNLPDLILEEKDYKSCVLEVVEWLEKAGDHPERVFLKKVSKAMYEWVRLLDSSF